MLLLVVVVRWSKKQGGHAGVRDHVGIHMSLRAEESKSYFAKIAFLWYFIKDCQSAKMLYTTYARSARNSYQRLIPKKRLGSRLCTFAATANAANNYC